MSSFALHSASRNAPFSIGSARLIAGLVFGLSLMFGMAAGNADTVVGGTGELPQQSLRVGGEGSAAQQPDLIVDGKMTVSPGTYMYGNVNIRNGGTLSFQETANSKTDFWASSIIIENGGSLTAGDQVPFGTKGGVLTIHLYGMDQSSGDPVKNPGQGALCKSALGEPSDPTRFTPAPCGIGQAQWESNGASLQTLPGGVSDFFYEYGPLYGDGLCDNKMEWMNGKCPDNSNPPPGVPVKGTVGYFGYKVLAVSYGGTLVLSGNKGASYDAATNNNPGSSGASWIRLDSSVANGTTLTLDNPPNNTWADGDKIVVTTTDYLPGHSEPLTINEVQGKTITVNEAIQWPHNGVRYGGPSSPNPLMARLPKRLTIDPDLVKDGAETRAAVALLTRSIRIVSEGDTASDTFEQASLRTLCPDGKTHGCYYFGAHTVFRQGFLKLQIQGVEFAQMGQGGRLAHYPVHFHMARQTPQGDGGTFVKDSSVNESMTRWYVIHSTQGVTLARNVGWKSIGHGYYLEDATETDNNFYSNIGIFARAAVDNDQNDRKVPGILDYDSPPPPADQFAGFPFRTDSENPSVFWITNGWNDFIGNLAAGAGTCGACYWFVPASNSDMPDVPSGGMHMKWSGYAALQSTPAFNGTTPLKSFYGNYCTSAMLSFQTTGDAPACAGVVAAKALPPPNNFPFLQAVPSIAPKPNSDNTQDSYYPHALGGNRAATRCKPTGQPGQYSCDGVLKCANGNANSMPPYQDQQQCAVTLLDHYTSAFNWANGNISAVWLRPQWALLDNSVLSDVQNGALTFITGGDYTHASIIEGYWGLARNSIFIGTTQPGNSYATNAGPFNNKPLSCDNAAKTPLADYCINAKEGISMPLAGFFVNQRFFNIYDGPAYEDSNAFLDIKKTDCVSPTNSGRGDCMYGSGIVLGVRKDPDGGKCYLPNAAIAWKQPNGFLYPPAFHSTNMFFDNVDIRHYVIEPLFQAPAKVSAQQNFGQGGTYLTDVSAATDGPNAAYCSNIGNTGFFNAFTGIDQQTELNDDDGSLTGLSNSLLEPLRPLPPNPLKQTISVNEDTFFSAPVETAECASNLRVDPSNACSPPKTSAAPVTAKTSPYDYVLTVVAPGCSQNPPPNKPDGTPFPFGRCGDGPDDPVAGQGGIHWSSDCANGACYGVPLYRQFLTGDNTNTDPNKWTREWGHWHANGCDTNAATPQCRWPFIRMAGANIYQRNTLTINHGTYYLETTVPLVAQQPGGEAFTLQPNEPGTAGKHNINVFEGPGTGSDGTKIDGKYYVFFLYAKPSTTQTYQIWVGTNAECNDVMNGLQAVRGNLDTGPIKFGADPNASKWFTPKCNVDGPGILTVTTDFQGLTDLDPTPANGLCKPQQYCCPAGSPGCPANAGKTCGCALTNTDPLVQANPNVGQVINECEAVCGEWAVKDLDCPRAGCYGFALTLPGDFKRDGAQTHRPPPSAFPMTADPKHLPDWTTQFLRTSTAPDDKNGGQCFYADPLPGTPGCPVLQ